MKIESIENLEQVSAQQWNNLAGTTNPFLRHEFLSGLEQHGCVGETWGWYPRHIIARDKDNALIGAIPLYLKDNSYGELVFDHAWADAYARAGLAYYPKLVSAIPYTPVTGSRLLVSSKADDQCSNALLDALIDTAKATQVSSLHCLFTDDVDTQRLREHGLLPRVGVQFHWHNRNYRDFDDFLQHMSSRKRKKCQRERRRVREAGISIDVIRGCDATAQQWQTMYDFYVSTFDRKWGYATLNRAFFSALGETMHANTLLILARKGQRYIAGALNFYNEDTLYGRHWGCHEYVPDLHFEVCYYQGIEFCIQNGLTRFEPGAQGEYKISRGFEPVQTWSLHWFRDKVFQRAVAEFLQHEQRHIARYIEVLQEDVPFKQCPE